jgi:hypothetical protein
VSELLSRVSSAELTEWMAYFRLEPWGTEPDDIRAGIIASTVANGNRDPKRQRKPFTTEDFMPKWGACARSEEQSPEDQFKILQQWQSVFAARHQ